MGRKAVICLSLIAALMLSSCRGSGSLKPADTGTAPVTEQNFVSTADDEKASLPSENSSAYCIVNGNEPFFFECELTTEPYQNYSELDSLGRCGAATAVIGKETIPTEERGKIGSIKPSGWHTVKYNGIVEGNYLYNRCHLIGYQLSGENDNRRNLITGTRYLNVVGMLPFENMICDHVMKTGDHVLYRVTPKFYKDNLLADGVLLEACSVEDKGTGLKFCVFCYNVQPGITIDYLTGDSKEYDGTPIVSQQPESTLPSNGESSLADDTVTSSAESSTSDDFVSVPADDEVSAAPALPGENEQREYIVNISSKRFHLPDCPSVNDIKEKNKRAYLGTRAELEENGYSPCQRCFPLE